MMQMVVSGHPSNSKGMDTQLHVHEGLHVDFTSTKMRLGDLETHCLTLAG